MHYSGCSLAILASEEVRFTVDKGETIEIYPNDTPNPSKLILGRYGMRILHVVAAINDNENEIIVVTVYEPDPHLWENDFKTRRKK